MTFLLVAFLIASGATYFVWRNLTGNISAASHRTNTVRVVAAAEHIKLGTVLSAGNLTTIEIAGTLPAGAIHDSKNAIGRGVTSDLYQGEPILESRLALAGSGGGLAATIPNGMRVCAVKVDDVVGVSGFVTPGMRVDVLVSGIPPGAQASNQGSVVKTLLQDIEVKSAGTDIQKDNEGKPQQVQVVNLLVTPAQAEILSLAASQTHIQLVLRNPLDTQVAQVEENSMGNLFSGAAAAPVASHGEIFHRAGKKKAPEFFSVEVWNGSKRTEVKFAAPEGKQ
jgi:pilus assembly protein CpaB